jgi:hypothetical protein
LQAQPGRPKGFMVLLQLDEKRGNYKLQEQKAIEVMLKAHHMDPKTDSKAKMIKGWRRPGRKGDAAGDLARTLEMVRRCAAARDMPKTGWLGAHRGRWRGCRR